MKYLTLLLLRLPFWWKIPRTEERIVDSPSVNVSPLICLEHLAGAVCCCTLSVFGIIVLVVMGMAVGSGDPYIGGHHLVATAEVSSALTSFS
jgi:hypothetical protein